MLIGGVGLPMLADRRRARSVVLRSFRLTDDPAAARRPGLLLAPALKLTDLAPNHHLDDWVAGRIRRDQRVISAIATSNSWTFWNA